jgi:CheY-like chemotaxis protein
MDIQMPEMNGYEATAAIRTLDRADTKTLPIVAMTADAFAQDAQRAREAGMNGHMAKPVDLGKLEKVLREWI